MASLPLFLPLSFLFLCLVIQICHAQTSSSSPISLVLPVTKDDATLQYLTTLSHGTPLAPTKLVLDLGGPLLWVDCASRNIPSSSIFTIPRRSIPCLTAKAHEIETQTQAWLSGPTNPADQDQPCQIFPENSVTGTRAREGELVEDLMALQSTEESNAGKMEAIDSIRFTCSPTQLLSGLASGARGMAGLGRTRSSLTSQIFDSFSTQRKITLCLSSSTGVVLFGSMAYESKPRAEILRSLTFTPLITSQNQGYPSQEYFINVNSIKISGKRLSLKTSSLSQDQEGNGGTRLSSVVPYTTMQSSIYVNFERAYMEAALSMNMTRVDSVAPFGLCFSSRGISNSQGGPNVPIIELVLQSEMVKWSIYGRNSMVRVSKEAMCLGFLDGGLNPTNPIVIGGYQMEDVLVQFDFDTFMVGFSPSLLMRDTSCSDFKFGSMPAESV